MDLTGLLLGVHASHHTFSAFFLSFFRFLLGRNLHIHHDAVSSGRNTQGRIFHVRGFFTEDRAEQALFRSQFRLALGRDLAHQDITGLDFRAHTDDTIHAQILQSFLTQVRDITSDFLRSQFRITGTDLKLINVDGSKDIFLHDALTDQHGILEVISIPRHERDQYIFAQSQLAVFRTRTVRDHIALLDDITAQHQHPLIDAGRRVGTHEFTDGINTNTVSGIMFQLLGGSIRHLAIGRDHDAVRRHRGHDTVNLGNDHRA